ncbi:hypothetical protein KBI52_12300 [Microvirga sp. HBU67558]|uniref:hypothetical protein n=1 Tax=Microvirga sp. HBU67558 TaxID=2824562 RepID=UPI001B381CDE|nr:hypothetical protein [Microvirga sp. HBU67558]MBQ0820988.1 hypothetical protein [Microvirga sp. HBU67558]
MPEGLKFPSTWADRAKFLEKVVASGKSLGEEAAANPNDKVVAFSQRLFWILPHLMYEWIWVSAATTGDQVERGVLPEAVFEFREALGELDLGFERVMVGFVVAREEKDAELQDLSMQSVLTGLARIQRASHGVISTLINPSANPHSSKKGHWYPTAWAKTLFRMGRDSFMPPQEALETVNLQQSLSKLASLCLSTRAALSRLMEAPSTDETTLSEAERNAVRVKRYRERKRRRVAFTAQVEIYDDDLDLLRQFGFLTSSEKNNQEAVSSAVQSFLLHGFTSFSDLPPDLWRDRLSKQRGRVSGLLGAADGDE